MIIYNDYKADELIPNLDKLKGRTIIINNTNPTKEAIDTLRDAKCKTYYCIKLYQLGSVEQELDYAKSVGYDGIAVDAENYSKNLIYSKEFGKRVKSMVLARGFKDYILLPENLGGDKYEKYPSFIHGLRPKAVLMERTYQQPEPWNILLFYLRNAYLNLLGIKVYIGIWPEEVYKTSPAWMPEWMKKAILKIQYSTAFTVSFGRIFWYSETKSMPE